MPSLTAPRAYATKTATISNAAKPITHADFGCTAGHVGLADDVMTAGAFSKTLAERAAKIKIFYMHDWEKLLGPAPEVIQEDSRGLYAKGRFTLASFWAGQVVWPLMKDGALTEGSIGY